MSKRISQIILTEDEPRRNPGTDFWFNPSTGKLYYWNTSQESWVVAISGGSTSTPTSGGGQEEQSQISTTDITEGTKLFFTNQRVLDIGDLNYLKLITASAQYLSKLGASAEYLNKTDGLSKIDASAQYTPLTTFQTQLVAAFAALESLSEALEGFDGDLATAIAAIYLNKVDASTIYATKAELIDASQNLDAAAVAYGLAL